MGRERQREESVTTFPSISPDDLDQRRVRERRIRGRGSSQDRPRRAREGLLDQPRLPYPRFSRDENESRSLHTTSLEKVQET